ncbi:hypothetical protein [Kribbella sp. VKM Ac-2568]|uniref:hypothetical protein n=1 Tax=Kribbella sp. VKM Ac-2568 TaxID=2512219 RepID=UPI00104EE497|nr:hypothetical protein [Kribbella sp. VKM Ac-2568]TCM43488.1 hypothetical protein EV648_109107 [Kribbella sp. VKM Ac-2568]
MSAHTTNTPRKAFASLAAGGAATGLLLMATTMPASATEPAPSAESAATAMYPDPPNYPNYAPQYEVTPVATQAGGGLDATSIALGGIAVGTAALGITLIAGHRRSHFVPRPTNP